MLTSGISFLPKEQCAEPGAGNLRSALFQSGSKPNSIGRTLSSALKTRRYFLGKAVRFLRETKDLSQRELAASSGIDPTEISRLEKGKSNPTHETLHRLAKGLGVPCSQILTLEEIFASAPDQG
jgi:DNA-binding XRE family transcriptional regulator